MPRRLPRARLTIAGLGTVALAVLLLAVPLPAAHVETWYTAGLFPLVQSVLTPVSNLTAVAFVDIEVFLVAAVVTTITVRAWRRRVSGRLRALASAAASITVLGAGVYLLFLLCWGLNYQRPALATRLAFDPSGVTEAAIASLARQGVEQLNTLHPDTRVGAWPDLEVLPGSALAQGFAGVQTSLGGRPDLPLGRPKVPWLAPYFRWAAIDGLTNPFGLEVLVNPEALPSEQPMIVAHEWAHLAGYAQEDEASFVGWAACLRGDARSRYSGWLFLVPQLIGSLPQDARAALWAPLDPGPRADLQAIADRLSHAQPQVRLVAWRLYDGYLKTHRVSAGVASYGGVVALVAGARFGEGWLPQLRQPGG